MAEYLLWLGASLVLRGLHVWEKDKDKNQDNEEKQSWPSKIWSYSTGVSSNKPIIRYSLVPPVFTRRFDRNSMAKSPLQEYNNNRNSLFNDYFTEKMYFEGNLLMSPAESAQHDINMKITVPRDNVIKPQARVVFRVQPESNRYSFTEVLIDTAKGGFANITTAFTWLRSSIQPNHNAIISNSDAVDPTAVNKGSQTISHPNTPLVDANILPQPIDSLSSSVFASLPLFTGNNILHPNSAHSACLGLRLDNSNHSLGCYFNPLLAHEGKIGSWLAINTTNVRGGVEVIHDQVKSRIPLSNYSVFYSAHNMEDTMKPNYQLGQHYHNIY
jgi:hypothetical protein